MNSPDFHQIRWRLCIAVVLCVLDAWPESAYAATVTVGQDAGQPGSACGFGSVQAAINQLPPDNDEHVIELQDGDYPRPQDTIRVAGRRVKVVTTFAAGSGCQHRVDDVRAQFSPADPTLAGGRQILVARADACCKG